MKVHYILGRKPKNKSIEAILAFDEGTTIRVFDIEMPFAYKFTVTPVDQTGYTEWEYHIKQPEHVPLVANDIERQGYKVTKIEPSVRKMIDLCPKCYMRGIPKIEKKNTRDNRERTWRNKKEISTKIERPPEYWLTYTHSKHEKCRICQYVNTPDPAYKHNKIEIQKYFYPQVIGNMKKGSIWYMLMSLINHYSKDRLPLP